MLFFKGAITYIKSVGTVFYLPFDLSKTSSKYMCILNITQLERLFSSCSLCDCELLLGLLLLLSKGILYPKESFTARLGHVGFVS